jgi:RNA polymerase sigma-70 factor (ECF subfamily)
MDTNQTDNNDKFLSLLLPNQKRILGYILTYVPNYTDADDILQNTLSILWKKFDQYEPGTDFLAYAVTIAKYEIMNYYRVCRKSGKLYLGDPVQQVLERESPSIDPHFNTRVEALKECIKKLSADETHLVQLRYEEEMPLSRIGQRLGISPPAALKKLSHIHSRLIRCIRLRLAFEGIR